MNSQPRPCRSAECCPSMMDSSLRMTGSWMRVESAWISRERTGIAFLEGVGGGRENRYGTGTALNTASIRPSMETLSASASKVRMMRWRRMP